MMQPINDNNPLSGVRVLVVEDDKLLAMDLEETLIDAGAIVVGVCQILNEGMVRANDDDFVVAVLDFSLGTDACRRSRAAWSARASRSFSTRGSRGANRAWAEWTDRPIVEKPAQPRVLLAALKTALSR